MSDDEYVENRNLPQSDLDLNLMLTDSVWGRSDVSQELKDKLNKYYVELDEDGNEKVTKSSLWGLLGFYTRDMRLGNLSNFNNELFTCRYMIDLANDFLTVDMIEPFLITLSRAATILETSQSKGGFLRRITNTIRQEHIKQDLEPPKKGFFGGKGKNQGGGY